jgi:hypothetical protein
LFKFKERVSLALAALSCCFATSVSAANDPYVTATLSFESFAASRSISIDSGETLHIYVDAYNSADLYYQVVDNNGKVVSSGNITDGSYRSYPKGVPVGKYHIELYCKSPFGPICQAYGSLDDN